MKTSCFILLFLICTFVFPQQKFSPFIQVENESAAKELRLDSTQFKVFLTAGLANVEMKQSFTAQADQKDLDFICPLDVNSLLHFLEIQIGDSIILLESKAIQQARNNIQNEIRKGRKISVTSQLNDDFLRIHLGELSAERKIKVKLKYTELFEPKGERFEFTLPKVAAVRYPNKNESDEKWIFKPVRIDNGFKNSFYSVETHLLGGLPITEAEVKTHPNNLNKITDNHFQISLASDKYQGDKEYKVNYSYATNQIEAALLSYEEDGCLYTLGMIQPPKKIDMEVIAPREYIFVMDISSSMAGFPLDYSKEMMKNVLEKLKPNEKFNILFFAGSSSFLSRASLYATPENLENALKKVYAQKGEGETKLSDALSKIQVYKTENDYNRVVVIISDGRIGMDEKVEYIINNNLKEAHFFSLGIGHVVERRALEQIALLSGTKLIIIDQEKTAEKKLKEFESLIISPLLQNIRLSSREINNRATFPQNFKGFLSYQPIQFVNKYCGEKKKTELKITAKDGKDDYSKELTSSITKDNALLEGIKFFWVRSKIDQLIRQEESCGQSCLSSGRIRRQIETLGETYNLATPYNSFLEVYYLQKEERKKTPIVSKKGEYIVNLHNDYDSDKDGIPDVLDNCPLDFGLTRAKGCPLGLLNETEKQKVMSDELTDILKGIAFDFDSDMIRKDSYHLLNEAIKIIKKRNVHSFILEGHTDAAGSKQYNADLSLRRAKAVYAYLISKGIPSEDIKVEGKGASLLKWAECQPISVCPEWKNHENRRVIFKINKL